MSKVQWNSLVKVGDLLLTHHECQQIAAVDELSLVFEIDIHVT